MGLPLIFSLEFVSMPPTNTSYLISFINVASLMNLVTFHHGKLHDFSWNPHFPFYFVHSSKMSKYQVKTAKRFDSIAKQLNINNLRFQTVGVSRVHVSWDEATTISIGRAINTHSDVHRCICALFTLFDFKCIFQIILPPMP